MIAKVYVTTFRKGENQGSVIEVGTYDMEVTKTTMPLVGYNGCISGEVVHGKSVDLVSFLGRQFVAREGGFGREFEASKATYSVSIPFELAQEFKKTFCPHCGKKI